MINCLLYDTDGYSRHRCNSCDRLVAIPLSHIIKVNLANDLDDLSSVQF